MPSLRSRHFRRLFKSLLAYADLNLSTEEQRTRIDRMAKQRIPLPKGITVQPVTIEGVPAEWLLPASHDPQRVILYLHGGGYVICSLDTHRGLAARLAIASRARLLNIDYRLAPEHPFPAALEDALAAYRGLLAEGISPGKIVIGGDSAGGGLALATTVSLRDANFPLPAALVLISPWTDLTFSGESIHTHADIDPILKMGSSDTLIHTYTGKHDPANPLISPLFADMLGLPPTLIHVGSDEILLSDSTRLEEKMKAVGVGVNLEIWQGMWHVWHVFAPFVPEATRAIKVMGKFIQGKTL